MAGRPPERMRVPLILQIGAMIRERCWVAGVESAHPNATVKKNPKKKLKKLAGWVGATSWILTAALQFVIPEGFQLVAGG